MAVSTHRELIHAVVSRKFDLADLNPVEARMIDTVIDATIAEAAEALVRRDDDGSIVGGCTAAEFLLGEFGLAQGGQRA